MRRALPLLTAATLLAALTACAGDAPAPADSTPPAADAAADVCSAESGSASKAVTVSDDLAAAPEVAFEAGIDAATTERTTVVEGKGEELERGSLAQVAFAVYNGATGAPIESYGYAEGETTAAFQVDTTQLLPGFAKTLGCASVGSRVVSVIPPSEGFGEAGNTDLEVAGDASLVLVMDIESAIRTIRYEAGDELPGTLPTVAPAADGSPTVAVPAAEAPKDLHIATLTKGDGEVVPAGSSVQVHYRGMQWSDGTVFDESWGGEPATFALDQVVPGFAAAIAGQTVGSQVLVVMPPIYGYGEQAPENTAPLAGQTLVFVVDILAIG
ncbi:MAG: peptidylprolyl isomerase [Naasia sp.]|nr:peptidylprolyl isomerase [Naasia sp.]